LGERWGPGRGRPGGVIGAVDETVLDNSIYQARLVAANTGYDEAAWQQWVAERAATPVPGALEFARAAAARGVTIYYITNRAADLAGPTLDNLGALGFPVADPGQFLGLGTAVDGCASAGSEKSCRRQLVGRTHRVLMEIGDQLGDFVALPANTPSGREQAVRPYLGWIGERWFVLPNPTYGSWEPALFGNDWHRSEADRRAAKRATLRLGHPAPATNE
jgi:5'-nucleotidase (lipoprotein e(P4) family)